MRKAYTIEDFFAMAKAGELPKGATVTAHRAPIEIYVTEMGYESDPWDGSPPDFYVGDEYHSVWENCTSDLTHFEVETDD